MQPNPWPPSRPKPNTTIVRTMLKEHNAAQSLAAFAALARDETKSDALTSKLAGVVQDTLEPENVTVWLKLR